MRLFVLTGVFFLLLAQAGCSREAAVENASVNQAASPSLATGAVPAVKASPEEPTGPQVLVARGIELYNKNRDEEAAELFRDAIRLDPDYAEAHFRLGLAHTALGRKKEATEEYQKAVEAYKKTIAENPRDPDGYFGIARAHARLGEHEEAVKAYKQAFRLEPDIADQEVFYELGIEHGKLAQYEEAVAALKKAAEMSPDDYRAAEALEKAKEGLKRREAFLKRLEERIKKEEAALKKKDNSNVAPTPSPSPAARPTPG